MRLFERVTTAPFDTKMPTRKTKGSAGYDFYLPVDIELAPGDFTPIIPLGVKAYMPEDEVLLLYIRSSIGLLKHVTLANCTGIIDSDYVDNPENEGNIGIVLHNQGNNTQVFKAGERIIQGIFTKYSVVDDDVTTGERKGATGSTGRF